MSAVDLFAPPAVEVERRADGSILVRSPSPLEPYPDSLGQVLRAQAGRVPERVFLAERAGDGLRRVTYGEAWRSALRLGARMRSDGLGPERPLVLLSDNSVDHALLQLGALVAGVPVAPLSPAYSLLSRDHGKLRAMVGALEPGWIFADDPAAYAPALAALAGSSARRVHGLDEVMGPDAEAAWLDSITPDQVAKILFTSGSTGTPKGVLNTHRMLCSNQQAIAQGWPFLARRPPVVVDWLPWSHTFGGNHNFNMVLWHGGTLVVDRGKPAPGRIEESVATLRAVAPTLTFNVPRGFEAILPFLERDEALARRYFEELDVLFYAAAALPRPLWDRLIAVSRRVRGEPVPFVSAWGATETAPLVTQVHYLIDEPGNIGLPAPGALVKLAPSGDKCELRVRGPMVTPGYFKDPARRPFDEEGFYLTGDAGRFADGSDPRRGLAFDGRIAEDFKLTSGTWVHVGALRLALIKALAPLVSDAVIAGHDRAWLGALVFVTPATAGEGELATRLAAALAAHNQSVSGSSSLAVRRLAVLERPPSIDAGEITDKGYLNQRRLLELRAADVERLFAEPPGESVICAL